jgi:hypothetical protein
LRYFVAVVIGLNCLFNKVKKVRTHEDSFRIGRWCQLKEYRLTYP